MEEEAPGKKVFKTRVDVGRLRGDRGSDGGETGCAWWRRAHEAESPGARN